jgi:hypothetical protein
MLAGSIPVFFHPGSAYVQYIWHLPKNYTRYSVFIPEAKMPALRRGVVCEDAPDANTLHIGQDLVVMVILNITDDQGGLTLVRSYSTKNALRKI